MELSGFVVGAITKELLEEKVCYNVLVHLSRRCRKLFTFRPSFPEPLSIGYNIWYKLIIALRKCVY